MRSIDILKLPTYQSPNLVHVMASVWPQLNNFQRKTGKSFRKPVKRCKSFRCWEVKLVPHDLWESSFVIILQQTYGLLASSLPWKNLSQILRALLYLLTSSAFTVFMPFFALLILVMIHIIYAIQIFPCFLDILQESTESKAAGTDNINRPDTRTQLW